MRNCGKFTASWLKFYHWDECTLSLDSIILQLSCDEWSKLYILALFPSFATISPIWISNWFFDWILDATVSHGGIKEICLCSSWTTPATEFLFEFQVNDSPPPLHIDCKVLDSCIMTCQHSVNSPARTDGSGEEPNSVNFVSVCSVLPAWIGCENLELVVYVHPWPLYSLCFLKEVK